MLLFSLLSFPPGPPREHFFKEKRVKKKAEKEWPGRIPGGISPEGWLHGSAAIKSHQVLTVIIFAALFHPFEWKNVLAEPSLLILFDSDGVVICAGMLFSKADRKTESFDL